jgi:GNAT superfamily N-acetyltransferase
MENVDIRPTNQQDVDWIEQLTREEWDAEFIVVHGEKFYPAQYPGFIASVGDEPVGLITYNIQGNACEVLSLNALKPGLGIGSRLIEEVKEKARQAGCSRLWLITTNDNLNALGFYQKRGFRLAALHAGAIALDRKLKPQIPEVSENGIPIRDEIELEMDL